MKSEKFVVMVDDNFHHTNTAERYKQGEYSTIDEAIEACKKIVERSIDFEHGKSLTELLENYSMFGDDPFIVGNTDFSAKDYAKEYCIKLTTSSE